MSCIAKSKKKKIAFFLSICVSVLGFFFCLFVCLLLICFVVVVVFLGGLTFLELIIVGLLIVLNQFYEVAFDVDTKCFALI